MARAEHLRVASLVVGLSVLIGCTRSAPPSQETSKSDKVHDGSALGEAQILAEGLDYPDQIVVDATNVYVRNSYSITRVPVGGGTPETVAVNLRDLRGLALDEDRLWIIGSPRGLGGRIVVSVPKQGGQAITVAEVADGFRLAVDDTDVFVAAGEGFVPTGRIVRVPKSGGTPVTLAAGLRFPSRIVLAGDDVFFAEYYGHRVRRVPKRGGPVSLVATGNGKVQGLAVTEADVFFTDGRVRRAPRTGGTAEVLDWNGANDVAADGRFVHWATSTGDGWVWRAPVAGGQAMKLALAPHRVEAIAIDGTHVYWAERGAKHFGLLRPRSGRVLRVAR